MLYERLLRPLLFRIDSERVHDLSLGLANCFTPLVRLGLVGYPSDPPALQTKVFGLNFKNPIGLAAGFDKDCRAFEFLGLLGFSHIELGTVTPAAQPGNPKPRIFRLPKDQALINRMGFPSVGAQVVLERVKRIRAHVNRPIIGINIGKQKETPLEAAADDYAQVIKIFDRAADYFVLNISSPNTPELRKLQSKEWIGRLLLAVRLANVNNVPVLVKIAPDLNFSEIDEIIGAAVDNGVSGIIATNTTFSRDGLARDPNEVGGLSGRPLFARSLQIVSYVVKQAQGRLDLVGCGGIMDAGRAQEMLDVGAKLVQIYTGLIYGGPNFVRKVKKEISL